MSQTIRVELLPTQAWLREGNEIRQRNVYHDISDRLVHDLVGRHLLHLEVISTYLKRLIPDNEQAVTIASLTLSAWTVIQIESMQMGAAALRELKIVEDDYPEGYSQVTLGLVWNGTIIPLLSSSKVVTGIDEARELWVSQAIAIASAYFTRVQDETVTDAMDCLRDWIVSGDHFCTMPTDPSEQDIHLQKAMQGLMARHQGPRYYQHVGHIERWLMNKLDNLDNNRFTPTKIRFVARIVSVSAEVEVEKTGMNPAITGDVTIVCQTDFDEGYPRYRWAVQVRTGNFEPEIRKSIVLREAAKRTEDEALEVWFQGMLEYRRRVCGSVNENS